ncbi:MAG: Hsp20/alpha crystallin family protein [Deltaproteobacteria bacterium]|nr:Hsp20/alpha crystallin family protein [Deltaproteobacteria bacterium]
MAKRESWLPLPVQRLSQEVDRLFDELIHRPWGFNRTAAEWNPQLDLYETETAFILEADLPGVREQDVSVKIADGDLVLQGKRSFEQVRTEGNFYCHERRSGQFLRRLPLPASVNHEQIRAEFRDGVLRVTLPKTNTEGKPQP